MKKKKTEEKELFYQPILTDKEWEKSGFPSFAIYRDYKNAKKDFPKNIIGVFTEDDIEEPVFIDDEDDRTKKYYVDIPNIDAEEWINVETFKTKKEAITFAQERFGADENGNVCLISIS